MSLAIEESNWCTYAALDDENSNRLTIAFYDEGTYIVNHTPAADEICKGKTILYNTETSSVNQQMTEARLPASGESSTCPNLLYFRPGVTLDSVGSFNFYPATLCSHSPPPEHQLFSAMLHLRGLLRGDARSIFVCLANRSVCSHYHYHALLCR